MKDKGRIDPGEDNTEINISPMIDMVFILLIFFIVTTTFVEEKGLDVNKPQASQSTSLENKSVNFTITSSNQVFFENEQISIGAVRARVSKAVQREQLPVIIAADNSASAGTIVRVMDEARMGGAEVISLSSAD